MIYERCCMETSLLKKYDKNDKKFLITKELMHSVNALMVSNRMHIVARRLTSASGLYGSELKNPMELHTLSLKGSIVKEMLSYDEKFIDSVMDILNGCKDIDTLMSDKKNDIILMALLQKQGSVSLLIMRMRLVLLQNLESECLMNGLMIIPSSSNRFVSIFTTNSQMLWAR